MKTASALQGIGAKHSTANYGGQGNVLPLRNMFDFRPARVSSPLTQASHQLEVRRSLRLGKEEQVKRTRTIMKTRLLGTVILTLVAGVSTSAQLPVAQARKPQPPTKKAVPATPDLRIKQYVFTPPAKDKDSRSYVLADDFVGQATPMSQDAATFALVAARFKNAGGNYNNSSNSDKLVLVQIVNAGSSASIACRLLLTIRKINGINANRQKMATVPALASRKDAWVMIDARSILPANVQLEATSFKLTVDATNLLEESNESNNEALHNQ
jgi:hypothetical protein